MWSLILPGTTDHERRFTYHNFTLSKQILDMAGLTIPYRESGKVRRH